ncbi:MAG: UDP-2,3-diacylglucosamine diphosphatase LpxI [Pseudomonadota bacterium]
MRVGGFARRAMPEAGGLAILAGRGSLPRLIAEQCQSTGRSYLVISFEADPGGWVQGHPHQSHRFEKVGALFRALGEAGCTEVVFAGAMDRPRLNPLAMDGRALSVAIRVLRLLRQGDDAMLRGLGEIFEHAGLRLVSAADCLPEGMLTASAGTLGQHKASAADQQDARRAAEILRALGPVDVGQAVVVAGGVCLGIEAVEGTDALLTRVADLPPAKRAHSPAPSGVLLKMPKPGQDRRVDLPTIGPRTVALASAAGLSGLVIEAEGVQLIDRAELVAAADKAGLFLWSATPGDLS